MVDIKMYDHQILFHVHFKFEWSFQVDEHRKFNDYKTHSNVITSFVSWQEEIYIQIQVRAGT